MKHRLVSVVSAVALLAGLLVGALPAQAAPPINYEPVDLGPQIRSMPATPDMIVPPEEGIAGSGGSASPAPVALGEQAYFLVLNDYTGSYGLSTFTLRAEGPSAQIWVQNNLGWRLGDPRPTPVVTDEQLAYLLDQFQSNMLPKETQFFRAADFHDGSEAYLPSLLGLPEDYYYDPSGRTIILVENVRDANYYDPNYPSYIAGFFSPAFETYFDRNVITIDAYDWANRVGPNSSPWRPSDSSRWRPYLYDGTFAHEYQHLLHSDADADEETWVNEGCSEFAQFLCGYGEPTGHTNFAKTHPENSLVLWGDQGDLEILGDYGQAYLWTLYLNDRFGAPFIQALFSNPDNGIAGINSTLAQRHIPETFQDLYRDWSVAELINSKTPEGGRYAFASTNFTFDIGTPASPNPEAYSTPGAPPWGTDYIWIAGNPKDLRKLKFNGLDYSMFPTGWTSDGSVLWSGMGDEIDNWAIFPATGGGTLTFDTKYDIEEYWDFGFVQVSTDGGHTWTSLVNGYTTNKHDPKAYPTVLANLPGLTGVLAEWTPMSFDLSAYAGKEILVAFRYVTDWATNGNGAFDTPGWYIDNVKVGDTVISDGSSVEPFKDITEILPINNDFMVTFVGYKAKGKGTEYRLATIKLGAVTEEGLLEVDKVLRDSDKVAMLVTLAAPQGFTKYVDYSYEFGLKSNGPKKTKAK